MVEARKYMVWYTVQSRTGRCRVSEHCKYVVAYDAKDAAEQVRIDEDRIGSLYPQSYSVITKVEPAP